MNKKIVFAGFVLVLVSRLLCGCNLSLEKARKIVDIRSVSSHLEEGATISLAEIYDFEWDSVLIAIRPKALDEVWDLFRENIASVHSDMPSFIVFFSGEKVVAGTQYVIFSNDGPVFLDDEGEYMRQTFLRDDANFFVTRDDAKYNGLAWLCTHISK